MNTEPNERAAPDRERLHRALQELAAELDRTSALDDRSREELREVMGKIRASLERTDEDAGESASEHPEFLERWGTEFGATYPQLARIIKQVSDALAGIGI